jgi:hypothetical protein
MATEDTGTPSFEEQVNEAINSMVETEGKWDFPEDVEFNEAVRYTANIERRRRDTQSSFTKQQQKLKALEAENNHLASQWEQDVVKQLTEEQQADLEELKHTDQEAWREKINKYEQENASKVKDKRNKIKEKVQEETELERRSRLLEEYNEANPEFQLTDDVIENDIPPRLTKKLATGELSFDEFLEKSREYLGAPKTINKGKKAPNEPDLSKESGGVTPQQSAVDADIRASYRKETY